MLLCIVHVNDNPTGKRLMAFSKLTLHPLDEQVNIENPYTKLSAIAVHFICP
jgi:hypothetical protein